MKKSWWENIMLQYPKALEVCKSYFQKMHGEKWRTEIQSPIKLIDFFEQHNISIYIHIKQTTIEKYGYKIQGFDYQIKTGYTFASSKDAKVKAIDWSFKILEGAISQDQYKSKFHNFGHRKKRKSLTPKKPLGEK